LANPSMDDRLAHPAALRQPPSGGRLIAPAVAIVITLAWSAAVDQLHVTKLAVALVAVFVGALVHLHRAFSRHFHLSRVWLIPAALGAFMVGSFLVNPASVRTSIHVWSLYIFAGAFIALTGTSTSDALRRAVIFLGLTQALIALGQVGGIDIFGASQVRFRGRTALGTLGNPTVLGIYVAATVPITFTYLTGRVRWFATTLLLAAVVASGARTAWVALSLWALWTAFRSTTDEDSRVSDPNATLLQRARLLSGLAVGSLVAIGVALGAALTWLTPATTWVRVVDANEGLRGRIFILRVGLRTMVDALPFGHGPAGFAAVWPEQQASYVAENPQWIPYMTDIRHAHIDLVEWVVEYGLVGVAALGVAGFACWRLVRSCPSFRRSGLGGLGVLVVSSFAMPIVYDVTTLTLALLVLGVGVCEWRDGQDTRPSVHLAGRALQVALVVGTLVFTCATYRPRYMSEVARSQAVLYWYAGDTERARSHIDSALERDATNAMARYIRAVLLQDLDAARCLADAELAFQTLPLASGARLAERCAYLVGDDEAHMRWRRLGDYLQGFS